MIDLYASKIRSLTVRDRLRILERTGGADFSSNDYLALSNSKALADLVVQGLEQGVPVGASGSRLLRGHHEEHELLEEEAARFFGAARMLYFGSGYAANLAVLSTLPQAGDLILHDALVHASAHDGMRASRAEIRSVAHNDADAFEAAIKQWRFAGHAGRPWLVVESLYSMDGDCAPLEALVDIADRYQAFLIVDEAHATGVYGSEGRGLASAWEGRENIITIHTCGKALGSLGALVGAHSVLCEYLINRARPFIYATAPPPIQAYTVRHALRLIREEPQRRLKLLEQVTATHSLFRQKFGHSPSETQILPVMIGDDRRAVELSRQLVEAGFDIRAIRPPTVPARTARLRITLTLNVDAKTTGDMLSCLADLLEKAI
ncbi:8-amino-7-oxononanoate synthase [Rhizobium helianthi]|uniref:8-amino-7-oxononanoate synthase n=1 Tax=Rhizobium helianthi TaxID=1132695 RepID=A0ABW4M2D5_9HYPH